MWDTNNWQRVRTLSSGSGIVDALFTPTGDLLLVLFRNKTIVGWDTSSFDIKVELKAPDSSPHLRCISISSNGHLLLSGGFGVNVFVWDLRAKTMLRTIGNAIIVFRDCMRRFFTDCTHAAILADDGIVRIVRVSDGPAAMILEIYAPEVAILHFSLDNVGRYLSACVSDGSLRLYDLDAALAHKRRVAQAKQSMGLIPDAVVNEASVLPAHSMYFKTSPGISKQKIITDPLKKAGFVGSPKKEHNPRESQPDYMPELRAVSCLNQGEQIPSEVQQRMRSVEDLYAKAVGRPVEPPEPYHPETLSAHTELGDVSGTTKLATNLAEDDIDLNTKNLVGLLAHFGSFPAKFRLLVWRFLLRLPQNRDHCSLCRRGIHPAWRNLGSDFPIKNQKLMSKLQRTLSALSYWSPVFAQLAYLPGLVFPFVKLFASDELAMFEAMLRFCQIGVVPGLSHFRIYPFICSDPSRHP